MIDNKDNKLEKEIGLALAQKDLKKISQLRRAHLLTAKKLKPVSLTTIKNLVQPALEWAIEHNDFLAADFLIRIFYAETHAENFLDFLHNDSNSLVSTRKNLLRHAASKHNFEMILTLFNHVQFSEIETLCHDLATNLNTYSTQRDNPVNQIINFFKAHPNLGIHQTPSDILNQLMINLLKSYAGNNLVDFLNLVEFYRKKNLLSITNVADIDEEILSYLDLKTIFSIFAKQIETFLALDKIKTDLIDELHRLCSHHFKPPYEENSYDKEVTKILKDMHDFSSVSHEYLKDIQDSNKLLIIIRSILNKKNETQDLRLRTVIDIVNSLNICTLMPMFTQKFNKAINKARDAMCAESKINLKAVTFELTTCNTPEEYVIENHPSCIRIENAPKPAETNVIFPKASEGDNSYNTLNNLGTAGMVIGCSMMLSAALVSSTAVGAPLAISLAVIGGALTLAGLAVKAISSLAKEQAWRLPSELSLFTKNSSKQKALVATEQTPLIPLIRAS